MDNNKLYVAMMNISDIRVETHISFAKHRYIVTFVGEGFFIAKRFRDGVERRFELEDIPRVTVEKPFRDLSYVAVDPDGTAFIYPWKPVKDDDGWWCCPYESNDEWHNSCVAISWKTMQKLTGKRIMTCMDEPVEVK